MMAAAYGHHECVSILVVNGANVNKAQKSQPVRLELECLVPALMFMIVQ